jgi:KTSC domain
MKTDEWNDHYSSHLTRSKHNQMDHTMDVEFQNGSVYRYHGVPPQEYQRFLDAPSQGRYHSDFIKSNYVVKRIK